MNIPLPTPVSYILKTLHQHQHAAYIVGGCVRDALLLRTIHDYDITTSASPKEVMNIFRELHITVIPTGLKHGTITLRIDHSNYEITTFRSDQAYENHRSPSAVVFASTLKVDVLRRDFTINALAYNEEAGILDYVEGLIDLENKIIRCVGEPHMRFDEDALRLLRGVRFALTLDFKIEAATWQAMRTCAPLLSYISKERIRDEWNHMLISEHPKPLTLLYQSNLLQQFLPEVAQLYARDQHSLWHLYDMFQHTEVALQHTKGYSLIEKLAIVFHDIGKPATMYFDEAHHGHFPRHAARSTELANAILKRLKYDHYTITTVTKLIAMHDYYLQPNTRFMRRFLAKLDGDYDLAEMVMHIQRADDMAKNPYKVNDKLAILDTCQLMLHEMKTDTASITLHSLAINGHDLIQLGYQGKQVGDILKAVLQQVIEEPEFNQKITCIAYIKKTFPL